MSATDYYVYMLRCSDGTYYTGITNDIEKRMITHNSSSQGAKYTKGRRPVTLIYSETCLGKGEALKREYAIKQLSRQQKELLIK